MERLADLFTTAGALADTNGDGYADDIALRFIAPGAPTAWEWCALADLAAVLGLHVTGFSPPLVVDAWDGPTLLLDPDDDATLPAGTGRITLDGATLIVRGGDAAGRAATLRALAQGSLPDAAEWQVITAQYPEPTPQPVPANPGPPPMLDDLCMMRGDADRFPGLLIDADHDRLPDDTCSSFVVLENISREMGAALVDASAHLGVETAGLTVPLCAPIDLGAAVPVLIGDAAPGGVRGVQPFLHPLDDGRTAVIVAGETEAETAAMLRALADDTPTRAAFPAFAEPQPAQEIIWSWEWQGQTERDLLMESARILLSSRSEKTPCDVLAQVSEPAEQRAAIRDEIAAMLPAGSAVTILPVHHAGRVWLEEIVAPAAKACIGLDALDVTCHPLILPDDTPCRDLSIRWLQECWPADELIAPTLGLPLERVRIALGAVNQAAIYRVRALDATGTTIGEWAFSPQWYARPFLPGFKEQGIVHVATGGLSIRVAGGAYYDAVPTDLDRFWDVWQDEALPQIREFVTTNHAAGGKQPFFDELRVEVWVSEPEYALGVREERESPAEGLAEDIYFNTLDYFHELGVQTTGKPWDEPGQIVPLVHVSPGEPPRAKVTLLRYDTAKTTYAPVPVERRSMGVAMDEVVTGTNLPGLLAYVNDLPGVTVRDVERSYRGRTIAAIEVVKPDGAAVRSRTKLAAIKPTHLIVARHHANEVASTTAALRFVELLATDPAMMPLLDRCNVVVIPDENPDGTALHALLMAEHPTWKHHAARYNAVGVEFSNHMSDPDTIYGEARVRPRLMREWRPDVITDNHGVPSHEWWQPFAGGQNPPRFRISYWLCQALIYGICRYLPDAPHADFSAAMRETVSRAIAAESDLAAANAIYAERYARWGHQYVPEMFPATYHGDMLWFFNALDITPATPPRDIALREPHMVSASWVTEVIDETAQGAHLALVAKAHLTANRALTRMMAENAPPVAFSATPLPGGRVHRRLHRMRPLPAPAIEMER
ncbi:MAG: M14 family metallopeptidase [Chloroflexota bacterium]|nr:M14 family metallopeptidase [Chloroflexota bacterium]